MNEKQKMKKKETIFLVDDHNILRTSLRLYLEQNGYTVVGEAGNGAETLQMMTACSPDVIVVDLTLPDMNGIQLAEKLLAQDNSRKLIALTMHEEDDYLVPFFEAGGVGYVNKTAASEELLQAIDMVCRDGCYVSKVGMQLLTRAQKKRKMTETLPLSEREREVLQYVVRGFTCREIGEQLFLSTRTVETYRMRIMHKLGLKNRSELVEYAVKHDFF